MARFTILGAGGFIGGHLARYLAEAGHDVATPSREAAPGPAAGHVIYAIGLTADFRSRPFDTAEAHVGRLTDVLRIGGFDSFLYLSSTRVYQDASATAEATALRVAPLDPGHLYNLTKLAGEALTLSCGVPKARVVRLSNVVGPGEAVRDTFLGALCREAAAGAIRLRSDPASAKDYLWIEDALPRIEGICLRGKARIYNLARGQQTRHAEWTTAVAAATGCSVITAPEAPDAGFPPIDITRLAAEFGPPPTDPRDRLSEILAP